jgi:hypothetical protein
MNFVANNEYSLDDIRFFAPLTPTPVRINVIDTDDTDIAKWSEESWVPFSNFASNMVKSQFPMTEHVFDYTCVLPNLFDNDGFVACVYDGFLQTESGDIIFIEAKTYHGTRSISMANYNFEIFKEYLYGNHLNKDTTSKIYNIQSMILSEIISDRSAQPCIKKYYFLLNHDERVLEQLYNDDWIPVVGVQNGNGEYVFAIQE